MANPTSLRIWAPGRGDGPPGSYVLELNVAGPELTKSYYSWGQLKLVLMRFGLADSELEELRKGVDREGYGDIGAQLSDEQLRILFS